MTTQPYPFAWPRTGAFLDSRLTHHRPGDMALPTIAIKPDVIDAMRREAPAGRSEALRTDFLATWQQDGGKGVSAIAARCAAKLLEADSLDVRYLLLEPGRMVSQRVHSPNQCHYPIPPKSPPVPAEVASWLAEHQATRPKDTRFQPRKNRLGAVLAAVA